MASRICMDKVATSLALSHVCNVVLCLAYANIMVDF